MIRFDRATASDVAMLVDVQLSAFAPDQRICGSGPPGYDSIDHQRAAIDRYYYYVIRHSGEVVGGFYFEVNGPTLHLIRLFVAEKWQSHGIGHDALHFLSTEIDLIETIELETPDFNEAAQRFYENFGFQKIRTVNYKSGTSFLYRFNCQTHG